MKKVIQFLLITILSAILLLIIIFVFNPLNLRTKLVSNAINSYLSKNLEDYTPLDKNSVPSVSSDINDNHPLLNDEQEKMLTNFGVNVSQLPTEITPTMKTCLIETLGPDRAKELAEGATPSALEIIKARSCIGE